jgi:hypothetical protein
MGKLEKQDPQQMEIKTLGNSTDKSKVTDHSKELDHVNKSTEF